jgi:ABC-2 type transport system permease protein
MIAAKILAVLVVEAVQVGLLIGLAVAVLDWRPPAGMNAVLLAAAVLAGSLAFGGLGLLLAGRLRAEATLALANGLFLAFLLLGGIIIPIDHLPGWLASLAAVLPAGQLTEVLRVALGGPGDPAGPMAALLAWGAGSTILAGLTFRWE